MNKKVYALINGNKVEIGAVVGFISGSDADTFSIRLDLIPVGGLIELVVDKAPVTGCVLRVFNSFEQSHNPTAPATIDAIKAYREVMGTGLGEAKERVERIKPVERPGLGPWGRSAWDYELSTDEAKQLAQPYLPYRSHHTVQDNGRTFPVWQLLFY